MFGILVQPPELQETKLEVLLKLLIYTVFKEKIEPSGDTRTGFRHFWFYKWPERMTQMARERKQEEVMNLPTLESPSLSRITPVYTGSWSSCVFYTPYVWLAYSSAVAT